MVGLQEIEIAAFRGLLDMLAENVAVTALEARRQRLPGGLAAFQFGVVDLHLDQALVHIDRHHIAGLHQRQRPADIALRRDVQNAGAIAGAAHPRVGDAHHVAHALLYQLGRHWQHAPFRHARPALRPGIAQDQHRVLGRVQILVVDRRLHGGIIVEDQRRPGVLQELAVHRRHLHDAAIRRQIALEHDQRAGLVDRVVERPDDVVVIDFRSGDVGADALARHGQGVGIEMFLDALQHALQPAGVIEILHQVGLAVRPDVGDHRHLTADALEIVEADIEAGAPPDRHHMDDRVGRTPHGHGGGNGVFKGLPDQHVAGFEILPGHLDDAPTGLRREPRMIGVGRRHRGAARQHEAQCLGDRGHGAGRAHGHAMAEGAGDPLLHLGPVVLRDLAFAQIVPVLPGIRPAAERPALPIAAQHRPRGEENRWQSHGDRPHQQTRRGLVATAHQHAGINRVRAQQLLRLHRQEVTVHHRRGLDDRLRQRDRRQLDREAAGLQDAALHMLDPLLEMDMALVDVGPGVDDPDDRFTFPVGRVIAHLHRPRAVPEGPQIVDAEPFVTAKFLVGLALAHVHSPSDVLLNGLQLHATA